MRYFDEIIEDRESQKQWLLKALNPEIDNFLSGEDSDDKNIIKSLNSVFDFYIDERIDDTILQKAISGVYKDNAENKKLGRVGQKYGADGKEDNKSPKPKEEKVTGVDFEHIKRFNLTEEYITKMIPTMIKNPESTRKFIQNLDKLANKLSEKRDKASFNEAKNLRNLKIFLIHRMMKKEG